MSDQHATPYPAKQRAPQHLVDIIHSPLAAWLILLVSIIITVAAWHISNNYAEKSAQERFAFRVNEAQAAINNRMQEYEQMLRGAAGLLIASDNVTRTAWRNYVSNLQIDKFWPGVQGVGYSVWVPPPQRTKLIKKIRAEGFNEFTIKPAGEREIYTSIIYLEPFSGRNLRAFGFDMYTEATRRAAMQRAIDTGEAAVSGRVTLVQETQKDTQAGFLMYLPLYRQPVTTTEERRAAIQGFVYSPFRIRDLMQGILGGELRDLDFEIYDGAPAMPEKLLYAGNQRADQNPAPRQALLSKSMNLVLGGNLWTINYSSTPTFTTHMEVSQPMVIAVGGVVVDLLLFYIVLSLANLRNRAVQLAEEMVEKLGEQQMHFKSISDTANDGIVSADKNGNINYFNKAAQHIFGYTADEILGRPISDLMPERYRAPHTSGFKRFIGNGLSANAGTPIELYGLRKSGDEFPLELSLSHWHANGRHHTNAVIRDISERKKVERMKSEFISTVSHELRTPLTAIRGALALIGYNSGDAPAKFDQGEMLALAQSNIERLSRLIDDLLDVEKMESSQLRLHVQALALTTLLETAVHNCRPAADAAGVAVNLGPIENVRILADTDRFQQIMSNLLSNAIKFSPYGSRITITTRSVIQGITISVADQGSGIPDAFRERIFQKFAQADASDSRARGGTGLGLSICKMLVERLDGALSYDSVPGQGQGSIFHVTLPVAKQAKIAV
ncbi:MAG: CHASE domain-containing protein [Pseudomonadota bacterium]